MSCLQKCIKIFMFYKLMFSNFIFHNFIFCNFMFHNLMFYKLMFYNLVSIFEHEYLREFEVKIGTARKLL
jgi:hypothetical protein